MGLLPSFQNDITSIITIRTELELSESQTVFIKRLNIEAQLHEHDDELRVFEMGFGTGLNFLLAAQAFLKSNPDLESNASKALHFYSVEANPIYFCISAEITASFQYPIDWQRDSMRNWIFTSLDGLKRGWNHHQPEEDIPIFLHLYWGNIQEINELTSSRPTHRFLFSRSLFHSTESRMLDTKYF